MNKRAIKVEPTTANSPETETWKRSLLPADATLRQVIRNLDETGLQIALVVSTDGALLGSITDGDIRRGLLRGMGLDSGVESIIHQDPLVVPPGLGRDAVIQLMHTNRIHQVPVVDEHKRVVGLHLLDDVMIPEHRPNLIVIMAGGKGTRLRPHTEEIPKPLLPVGGKPMLQHIIERARSEGFERFVLAVHYLGHMIEDFFGDGSRWQVEIDYLRERSPLGTVGALSLLNPRPEAPFLVTNGDVLSEIQYGELLEFHSRHRASATMVVRPHEWQHPFGVVRTKGVEIIGFDEKPIARTHVNAGIYALEPTVLEVMQVNEPCDMPTLFNRLRSQGARTIVYPIHEPWLDVGRPDDYKEANSIHKPS